MSEKDGKPKHNQFTKNAQYQDRLPFWPDSFFEQSNPLTRSSLFSISNRRKYFEDFTPVSVIGEGSIEYMGKRLNTFDEDVFLQLLQYCRGQSLLKPLVSSKSQVITDLFLSTGGKNYKKLMTAVNRLESGVLRVSAPHILMKLSELLQNPSLSTGMEPEFIEEISKKYSEFAEAIDEAIYNKQSYFITVRFILNSGENPKTGGLVVQLDPLMVLLFDGINTTRTDRYERSLLAPAEKRLLSYIHSHSGKVYPLKLETLHSLLASDLAFSRNKAKFTANLTSHFEALERLQRIKPGWKIGDDDKVYDLEAIPYTDDLLASP